MSRAWLVGAGPGDAELLTLKAVRAIGAADVLLVDDLVNPDVLRHARADARIEHVGKRGGHASTPQEAIVAAMLAHLRAGRSVARLKGGDPFVFGRGGEELLALGAAGFPVEVVNGITAGIAAPAALGIPVTHRGDAQGVIFVTGHGAGADEPDWRALAATRMTIVIYMGIRRLDAIVAALRDGGVPGDMPCAAIENATRDGQQHVLATLDTVVESVGATGIGSPAIVVIGRVAALADDPAVRAALGARRSRMMRVALGIGFRAGVTAAQLDAAIRAALAHYPGAEPAVVATLADKARARPLRTLCARRGWPLVAFDAARLAQCADAALSGPSAAALARFGVAGVAEPCARLAAPQGRLLGPKSILGGVTVALAGPL